MLLILDNYDSFTYNLQDYFAQLRQECIVFRNDEISVQEIGNLRPQGIVLSPGPETPARAGIMMRVIENFYDKIPLLGICLGHQGIGEFFGATLIRAEKIMHGKTSPILHSQHPLFETIVSPFEAMRYHSLILTNLDRTPLKIIASTPDNEIMGIVHPGFKVAGIQFHPESILTPDGISMLRNWISWSGIH